MPKPRRPQLLVERSRHGRTVYYVRNGHGRRIRLPDDYGSKGFWEAYEAASSGASAGNPAVKPQSPTRIAQAAAMNTAHRLLNVAKARAARLGLPFDLSIEWVTTEMERQKFRCALTGIPFETGKIASYRVNPFSPSLDRISNSGGYTTKNVRIVLFAVNVMLNEWGLAVFEKIANHYRAHKGTKSKLYSLTLRKE